ncbi:MAG: SdpI family protein [Devosia sp.]
MTALRVFTRLNHLLLSLIAVSTIAGVVTIPGEARLPIHWDIFGQPDRFAGRDEALILMPVFALALLVLFWAIGRFASPERLAGGRHVMDAVLPVLLALFLAFQLVLVFQFDFAIARVVAWGVAALLIVLGNVLPKSQPNLYGGIRLKATLADPANWAATHRFTGLAMMAAGGLLLILTLLTGEGMALIVGALVAAILPLLLGVAYSWWLTARGKL